MVHGFWNQPDCTTVAITSDANSTLAKMSDYILEYDVDIRRVNRHEDLTSQIPCLFLIETLSEVVSQLEENK